MTLRSRQEAALEPVRAALLRQAEDRAAAIVQRARDEASAMLERARQDAADLIAISAADGRAQASQVMQARLGVRRREAREQLLNSDLTSYQDLADRIRNAVLALRSDAGYPRLRARLAGIAARAAGPGATVTEPADGGAVATAPGIVVDCSLRRMADRAILALGPAIAALCEQPGAEPDGHRRAGR